MRASSSSRGTRALTVYVVVPGRRSAPANHPWSPMRRTIASASTATGTPGLSNSLPGGRDVSIVTVSGDVRSADGASSPAACNGSPDGTRTVATSDCSQPSRPTLSNVAARHRRRLRCVGGRQGEERDLIRGRIRDHRREPARVDRPGGRQPGPASDEGRRRDDGDQGDGRRRPPALLPRATRGDVAPRGRPAADACAPPDAAPSPRLVRRPLGAVGQPDREDAVELDIRGHAGRSIGIGIRASASIAARIAWRAAWSRDLTVPTEMPSASAISATERPW